MSLVQILVFIPAAALTGIIIKNEHRALLLVAFSTLALFWLQPAMPIRQMDFWLPLATIVLTIGTWVAVRNNDSSLQMAWPYLALIGGLLIVLSLSRFAGPLCCLTATHPPGPISVIVAIVVTGILVGTLALLQGRAGWLAGILICLLLGLLVILKTDALALWASGVLRDFMGQSIEHVSAVDIGWLGISYIAFRLIHTLRDRQLGRLPALSLPEFVSYVLFFPTITAGPIDRAERFITDLRADKRHSAPDVIEAARRIAIGLFSKFVLADSLALIALTPANATQIDSTSWLWVLTYGYALRIYFDFAGYSDIAIGLGKLAGFTIPENFDRPYLQPNLTAFWNSWHMTLAQWFRGYYFYPLSRWLIRLFPVKLPVEAMISFCQISTMVLIGLWHGVSLNFAMWGLWHGLGLFIHNRWASATRLQAQALEARPLLKRVVDGVSTLLVFHFVALGWVWFALPHIDLSWHVLTGLFGF